MEWFVQKAERITAVDLSEQMLAKAKEKISSEKVQFKQADIARHWSFTDQRYDLVSFSLVLEHINDLDFVFNNTAQALTKGGHVYIGELHPFKQYSGSKARFETEAGVQIVQCFNHHISDFTATAKKYGLTLVDINEHFDDNNRSEPPRILTIILKKL